MPPARGRDRDVEVRRPGPVGRPDVRHRATSVVVPVELDVAVDRAAHEAHALRDLVGRRGADRVRQADPVDAEVLDELDDAQEVAQRRAEGVLAGEAHRDAPPHHGREHVTGGGEDAVEVPAVGVGAQGGRSPEDEVEPADAARERALGVLAATADVGSDLCAQPEGSDALEVGGGPGRGERRGHLDDVDAEPVQGARDGDALLAAERGAGELLPPPGGCSPRRGIGGRWAWGSGSIAAITGGPPVRPNANRRPPEEGRRFRVRLSFVYAEPGPLPRGVGLPLALALVA